MNEYRQKGGIFDEDFMIHVLNNLLKYYNVFLDGFENHLTATGDGTLTIDVIHKKLNHWYEKIKNKEEEKVEKKKPVIKRTSNGAASVVSMATNLEIKDVLKIKMIKKKNIRK